MGDPRLTLILNCTNHPDTPIVNASGLCLECWKAKIDADYTHKHDGSCCDTIDEFMAEKRESEAEREAKSAAFREYCKEAAETVATWPEWKQRSLG